LGANALNIGVAHVSGNVELDVAQPTNSMLDLSIDPVGQGRHNFGTTLCEWLSLRLMPSPVLLS
jgi:hypothetical protein